MEAVVVVDMGNEEVSNEKKFQNWFNEHGCKLNDDTIFVMIELNNEITNNEVIQYTFFEKANTVIFKFETDGEYFPPVLIHFIEHLTDMKETQISVAEEGQYGEYNNLIDMTLKQFIDNVINGED